VSGALAPPASEATPTAKAAAATVATVRKPTPLETAASEPVQLEPNWLERRLAEVCREAAELASEPGTVGAGLEMKVEDAPRELGELLVELSRGQRPWPSRRRGCEERSQRRARVEDDADEHKCHPEADERSRELERVARCGRLLSLKSAVTASAVFGA